MGSGPGGMTFGNLSWFGLPAFSYGEFSQKVIIYQVEDSTDKRQLVYDLRDRPLQAAYHSLLAGVGDVSDVRCVT